ncbi:MAG: immunoglobulin domain-containing protein [Limisphaerales bacterium]
MDANTNLFICGKIAGSSPTTIGTDSFQASNYYGACYIAKLDSAGNVLWARFVTGTDTADFNGLAVDASGNAFVCGQLYHRQTFGTIIVPDTGGYRPFVAKINGAGDWQWVNAESGGRFGGWAFSVSTDSAGNPCITGTMGGGDIAGNTFFGLPFPKSGECPFVAKFNGASGATTWVTNAPTQGFYALSNIGREIAVASDGSAYVGGHFYGQGVFGTTTLTPFQYAEGDVTFFLARISAGGQWLWATMGEATPHAGSAVFGLAVDSQDNAWMQGYTSANYFYGAGTDGRVTIAGQTLTNTSFIAKANSSGSFLLVRRTRSAGPIVAFDTNGYTCWSGPTGLGVDGLIKFGPAVAPAFTQQPAGGVVRLGDSFTFTAAATGLPVYYQWRKEGVPLDEFRESQSTNGAFQLAHALPGFITNNIGNYSVVLSNSAGMVTSAVASVVAPAPAITGLFDANTNAISVAAPLDTILVFGTNFTGATSLALGSVLIGSYPADSPYAFSSQYYYGAYTVLSDTLIRVTMPVYFLDDPFTVTTPGGTATSAGTVRVNMPVFESASTNTVGRNQYFSTWDSPHFTFQWFKDTVPLTNGTRIGGATTAFLTVSNLVSGDAGTYYVVASAGGRSVQGGNLPLTILPTPPNLSITGASSISGASVGDTGDFSVTVTGDSPVSYQWFKDGAPLTNSARISGATTNALRITSLQVSDSGTYSVVMTVASGTLRSGDMPLRVTVSVGIQPPGPQNQTLFIGSNVTFSVTATGTPPLSFHWFKDGTPLTNDARISGATGTTLVLSNLTLADAGAYSIAVSNSTSSATASARLDPVSPPVIISPPASQTNRAGSFASLSVVASGLQPLSFQWCKDGTPLPGRNNSILSISPVRLGDAGGYSVIVTNFGGSVTSSVATLTVAVRSNLFSGANITWVREGGSTNFDVGHAIALDPSGNVFVAGSFGDTFGQSPSTGSGTFGTNVLAANGRRQFFVAKLDSLGNFQWVRTAGGTAEHEAFAVAADPSGNVLVSGSFNGTAAFGAGSLTSAGAADLFLTKLDGAGNFLWAAQVGRTNDGYWAAVQTDAGGNAYWAGTFKGRVNLGTNSLVSAGGEDVFLAFVNSSGAPQWATSYGGTNDDMVWSLSLQPGTTNLYMAGLFATNITLGPTNLAGIGTRNGFLARLAGDGTVLRAMPVGALGFNEALGVAADSAGNAYLTGSTTANIFTAGGLSVTNGGNSFGYLLKVNSNCVPQWLRRINESGGGHSVALDAGGNPVVAGWLVLPNFDQEVFVTRLDPLGNPLGVAVAGGAGSDLAYGVAAAPDGPLYITGFHDAAGIGGATFGGNTLAGLGSLDIFVARLPGVPHRPLRIHSLARQTGGTAHLVFGHDDHSPLDVNRRPRLKLLGTGDISLPRASWQQLTNTVVNSEGELQLDDANAIAAPRRFYLIVDEP